MHDLRLVGVHEDGEHLVLADAEGERHLLAVDESLRAAVRRDRPHLGQLQIEIEGGLRPRDVQMRIRAGASAEEVAALAGWTVEKVRRYEGPVLAERAHVAGLAREVRLRRRSGQVTLGSEVARRLVARGVDSDRVRWDSWRVEGDPWTVVVEFSAGGRDRTARWQFDPATRSVTPGDDEARWLSEDQPEGEGPLAGARLTSVPLDGILGGSTAPGSDRHQVYDLEGDGGLDGPARRGRARDRSTGTDDPLDLMTAMRSRRQGKHGHRRPGASTGDTAISSTHPAGRQRPRVEPLDLDPTLMDDPPAAHPRSMTTDEGARDEAFTDEPASIVPADRPPTADLTNGVSADRPPATGPSGDAPHTEDLSTAGQGNVGHGTGLTRPGTLRSDDHDRSDADGSAPTPDAAPPAAAVTRLPTPPAATGHWPLAEAMRQTPPPALSVATIVSDQPDPASEQDGAGSMLTATPGEVDDDTSTSTNADAGSNGRHRGGGSARRSRRSSVPSWDDIMFGTRKD